MNIIVLNWTTSLKALFFVILNHVSYYTKSSLIKTLIKFLEKGSGEWGLGEGHWIPSLVLLKLLTFIPILMQAEIQVFGVAGREVVGGSFTTCS